MQKRGLPSISPAAQDSWVYRVLGDQNFTRQQGFFATWYRLTSPPNARPDATFQQRERIQRARLASALMLFLGTVLLLAGAIGITSPNHTIAIVVSSMLGAILISIPINRHGKVELVGLLMVLGLTVGMYTSIGVDAFTVGMSPNDKDILYLLFFSELFAGALLPINGVFLIAAVNIAFSFVSLRFFPHDPALVLMLKTSFPAIFPRLVQIHIIASGVMWILVNNLKAALGRADRAEEIARLQHDIAAQASERAGEKQELEQQIEAIACAPDSRKYPVATGRTTQYPAGPLSARQGRRGADASLCAADHAGPTADPAGNGRCSRRTTPAVSSAERSALWSALSRLAWQNHCTIAAIVSLVRPPLLT